MNGRNGYGDGYPDPGRSNRYDGGGYGNNNNNNSSSNAAGSVSLRDRRAGGYTGFYGNQQPSSSSLDVSEQPQQGRPSTSSSSRPRLYDPDAPRRRHGALEDGGYGGSGGSGGSGGGSNRSVERGRAAAVNANGSGETGSGAGLGGQRVTGNFCFLRSLFLLSLRLSLLFVSPLGWAKRKQWLTTI